MEKLVIEKMYAFIVKDTPEGEGLAAIFTPNGWMPLVGADIKRVNALRPAAQDLVNHTKKEITLCYFSERTEIEIIKPNGNDGKFG